MMERENPEIDEIEHYLEKIIFFEEDAEFDACA